MDALHDGSLPPASVTRPGQRTLRQLTPAFCAYHTHLQTKSGEPSSLHQPAPPMLIRAVLPTSPFKARLLRGQNIFDFETCPIRSLSLSTSHKKDGCSSFLPCTLSLRSATTFCLRASPPLHLTSSLYTNSCLFSSLASFTMKCVRSKACAQSFREPLIWALSLTYLTPSPYA